MSEIVALVILCSGVGAIICAAVYAAFARPSTARGEQRRREIISGFRLTGGVLLGILLMTCVVYGAHLAIFGGSQRVSRPIGGIIASTAFGLIALTVQRWAKYFAGWVIWGVYNSILMAISGHVLNEPSIRISRWYALATGAVYLATALPTRRFTNAYTLRTLDKFALMTWILAFTGGVLFPRESFGIIAIGAGALVIAWVFYRFDPHPNKRKTYPRTIATPGPSLPSR